MNRAAAVADNLLSPVTVTVEDVRRQDETATLERLLNSDLEMAQLLLAYWAWETA